MQNKGILIIVSGPSGVGKGTICKQLLADCPDIVLSVSATTRSPRPEDTEGVTYYFKTQDEFKSLIDTNSFIEWAIYNGNYYGTLKDEVTQKLN
ncbi:MAG: guanylate kinase, partial [Oscillospiraceae bacterium]